MKKTIFLLTALFFIFFTQACNKKDKLIVMSKTELLTTGTWKLTAVVADEDGNGSYETDRFATFSVCFTDNYYTFSSNGILELNEGPTKCSPTAPQTETSTWQLTQNETHLKNNNDDFILEELTKSTLKWKEEYAGGRSALVTFTKR
jgi:hypothetical protein